MLEFTFIGKDGGAAAAVNSSHHALTTAWKTPAVVTDTNTSDIKLGGTYASYVVTGGIGVHQPWSHAGRRHSSQSNRWVASLPNITDRDVTGNSEFDPTAAQEVALLTSLKATTLQSLSPDEAAHENAQRHGQLRL
jgi:hypothetical protein